METSRRKGVINPVVIVDLPSELALRMLGFEVLREIGPGSESIQTM